MEYPHVILFYFEPFCFISSKSWGHFGGKNRNYSQGEIMFFLVWGNVSRLKFKWSCWSIVKFFINPQNVFEELHQSFRMVLKPSPGVRLWCLGRVKLVLYLLLGHCDEKSDINNIEEERSSILAYGFCPSWQEGSKGE